MRSHANQTHTRGTTFRTHLTAVGLAIVIALAAHNAALLGWPAQERQSRSANDRMLEPGPEAARLSRRVGTWDVVMTMRPTSDAEPLVVKGLVADRVMIGLYLQETMRPAQESDVPDFRRIEYPDV